MGEGQGLAKGMATPHCPSSKCWGFQGPIGLSTHCVKEGHPRSSPLYEVSCPSIRLLGPGGWNCLATVQERFCLCVCFLLVSVSLILCLLISSYFSPGPLLGTDVSRLCSAFF